MSLRAVRSQPGGWERREQSNEAEKNGQLADSAPLMESSEQADTQFIAERREPSGCSS